MGRKTTLADHMNEAELSQRRRLLYETAQRSLMHLNSPIKAKLMNGDTAILDEDRLDSVIEDYHMLIEQYRAQHQPPKHRIAADKIAAMTAFMIMKHRPIYPEHRKANHRVASLMAEMYAFRCIGAIMKISYKTLGASGPHLIRALSSLENLRKIDELETLLDENNIKTQPYQRSSETVISWMIAALTPFRKIMPAGPELTD